MDAHSGGVETQNGVLEGKLMRIRIRIDFGMLDSDPGGQNDPQK